MIDAAVECTQSTIDGNSQPEGSDPRGLCEIAIQLEQ